MPLDTAENLGLTGLGFKVRQANSRSGGANLIIKLPYKTRIVPEGWTPENPDIDLEACRKEEAALLKAGWVDSPSKIQGLPLTPSEQEDDPLPDAPQNQPQLAASQNQRIAGIEYGAAAGGHSARNGPIE